MHDKLKVSSSTFCWIASPIFPTTMICWFKSIIFSLFSTSLISVYSLNFPSHLRYILWLSKNKFLVEESYFVRASFEERCLRLKHLNRSRLFFCWWKEHILTINKFSHIFSWILLHFISDVLGRTRSFFHVVIQLNSISQPFLQVSFLKESSCHIMNFLFKFKQ